MESNNYYCAHIIRDTPDRWVAIAKFIYTVGILEGSERDLETGYTRRFCYPDFDEAVVALLEWQGRAFKDKPLDYITEK